ncbi:MAG: SLC13 family permease [Fuerstiella sp.]
MPTVFILAIGLTIVIGGILLFRLHAFVALILAGLTVAILTPGERVSRAAQLEAVLSRVEFLPEERLVASAEPLSPEKLLVAAESPDGEALEEVGSLVEQVDDDVWPGQLSFPDAVVYQYRLADPDRPASWLYLVPRTKFNDALAAGSQTFMSRLTTALGSYCGQLAILIVAASIIGRCLLDSGAADRIVRSALATVGERNAPAAFVVSGFTLSIPVFFDTVFYLMIPLGKALRLRTGGNYLLYVLSIVAGGTMAHSLVPPTPGPLFIAEAFEVSIGAMIAGGCLVGLFSSSVAMLYAIWVNRHNELKLPDADLRETEAVPATVKDDAAGNSSEATRPAPGLFVSLMPIVLPIVLISLGAAVTEVEAATPDGQPEWSFFGISISESTASIADQISEKNFALLVSAIFAVLMYVWTKRPGREQLSRSMQEAVTSAGTIILVTAAGGAFGRMMRQTSVAELLQDLPNTSPLMIVIAAFLVTTAVRTAQGSSTVAMITAAGIFGGLVTSGAANVDPLYVALAVGCGSKPIAWMNDSGFWVITRMSGMTEKEGLKYVTPMTALAGLAGLLAVIVGVIVFP